MARGDFKQRVVFEVEDQASGNVKNIEGNFSKLGSFLSSKFTKTLGDVDDGVKKTEGSFSKLATFLDSKVTRSLGNVDGSLKKTEGSFSEVDAGVKKTEGTFSKLATFLDSRLSRSLGNIDGSVKKTKGSFSDVDGSIKKTEGSFSKLATFLDSKFNRSLGNVDGSVKKAEGSFSKFGSFLASKFVITLGDVIGLFKSLAGAAGDVVKAAEAQENAVASLDQSLASLGTQAAGVSQALQDQAAALEATTTFSDEAIIANQALAINLGVGADQAEKLTAAAVELSSATGGSLESSFVNLSRTLNGFRGELGELVPEVATLSVESLKSGAALDVVLDRLGGSAAAKVGTFAGTVTQLGNAWGSVKEKLGEAITENEGLRNGIAKLRDVITSQKFLDGIETVATGFAEISTKALEAVGNLDSVIAAFKNLRAAIEPTLDYLSRFATGLGVITNTITFGLADALETGARNILVLAGTEGALSDSSQRAADSTARLAAETNAGSTASESYSRRTEDVTDSVSSRTEAETEGAATTRQVTQSTEEATSALITYEEAERSLRGETDELTQSLQRTARAAAQVTAATGGRLTARSARSQADVDAALAAGRAPTLGGTRIRTADGSGSRLLR